MPKPLKIEGMSIFVVVWLGQLVSLLGSSLSNFALDVWVYQQSGSVTQLSFLILFTTLPSVIISPFAGVLVDSWNRRWVMILSDSGAALSTLTLAALLVTGKIQIWHIYLASAVISSFSAFQWPAYSAATTLLVPKKYLGRASGMTHLAYALGQLFSPILGGVLLGIIQLSGIFVVDLGSFVFALTTLLLVRFPYHKVTRHQQINKTSLLTQAIYGFHYLKARSGLLALLLFLASSNFLVGILQVLIYPLILSFASSSQLGTIMSLGGVGMLTGGLFMSTWGSGRQNYINIFFCFMLLNGFSMIVAGFYPSIFMLNIAAFLFFLGLPFISSSSQVIFQKKVAPDVQGRVFSLKNAISGSCLPLAYLVAGPLADRIFEPLMTVNGALAGNIGKLIGTGPGRGIGLMFIVFGTLTMLMTIIAYQYAPLRLLEHELPDIVTS
ncbi:MAG: MFS transporter [Komarekiella atlantica HA4396-MV6]|jgi:MFS family permease|nr:MFS transporter [Komarekiella atlantica HA4396-MV6]